LLQWWLQADRRRRRRGGGRSANGEEGQPSVVDGAYVSSAYIISLSNT
jgi:hypothetical protein